MWQQEKKPIKIFLPDATPENMYVCTNMEVSLALKKDVSAENKKCESIFEMLSV